MNSQIIIYGSEYGSTKRYAERLSEITGVEAINYKYWKPTASRWTSWIMTGSNLSLRLLKKTK